MARKRGDYYYISGDGQALILDGKMGIYWMEGVAGCVFSFVLWFPVDFCWGMGDLRLSSVGNRGVGRYRGRVSVSQVRTLVGAQVEGCGLLETVRHEWSVVGLVSLVAPLGLP